MKVKTADCDQCREETVYIKPRNSRKWRCTGRPASEKTIFESAEYQNATAKQKS